MANDNYTPEQLKAARAAKSIGELIALAKSAGIELSHDLAAGFFAQRQGELADEELDNVAGGHGGMCHNNGREVITLYTDCVHGLLKTTPKGFPADINVGRRICGDAAYDGAGIVKSSSCEWMSYEQGLWLCNYPEDLKK